MSSFPVPYRHSIQGEKGSAVDLSIDSRARASSFSCCGVYAAQRTGTQAD